MPYVIQLPSICASFDCTSRSVTAANQTDFAACDTAARTTRIFRRCTLFSATIVPLDTGGDTAAASASAAAAAALGSAPAADKKPARSRKPSVAKPPAPVLLPPVADEPFELPSAAIKSKETVVDSEVEKERVRIGKQFS